MLLLDLLEMDGISLDAQHLENDQDIEKVMIISH
jgi:hypothetical protein